MAIAIPASKPSALTVARGPIVDIDCVEVLETFTYRVSLETGRETDAASNENGSRSQTK